MLDLYGKSHCYVNFGTAGAPMRTVRAPIKATATHGKAEDSNWRVRVPGFGWRVLRYPTLRDQLAGQRLPFVNLAHGIIATVAA